METTMAPQTRAATATRPSAEEALSRQLARLFGKASLQPTLLSRPLDRSCRTWPRQSCPSYPTRPPTTTLQSKRRTTGIAYSASTRTTECPTFAILGPQPSCLASDKWSSKSEASDMEARRLCQITMQSTRHPQNLWARRQDPKLVHLSRYPSTTTPTWRPVR